MVVPSKDSVISSPDWKPTTFVERIIFRPESAKTGRSVRSASVRWRLAGKGSIGITCRPAGVRKPLAPACDRADAIASDALPTYALPRSGPGFASFLDVTCAGFFAAVCDSALGSGVQVKFRCPVCGALTEKPIHCGAAGTAERGLRFMTNDAVNFCNNLLGALAALGLYAIHH